MNDSVVPFVGEKGNRSSSIISNESYKSVRPERESQSVIGGYARADADGVVEEVVEVIGKR